MENEQVKHTPGPWIAHGYYIYRAGADGERTGTAIANTRVDALTTPDEERANARLIAAAPELLDVLQDIVRAEWTAVTLDGLSPQHRRRLERARALIAKAAS